jgi:hypothetical protein
MSYRIDWLSEPQGLLAGLSSIDAETLASGTLSEELIAALGAVEVVRVGKAGNRAARKRRDKRFILSDFLLSLNIEQQTEEFAAPTLSFTLLFDHTRACPNPIETIAAWSELAVAGYLVLKEGTTFRETTVPQDRQHHEAPGQSAAIA